MSVTTTTQRKTRTVALVGNPNTGKSTLFGALCRERPRVGNYPGVTVEEKVGRMTDGRVRWSVIDLPGIYSLAPRSPDERVAVDVLLGRRAEAPRPDVILCVVAADNLERNLYLVGQVLGLGHPTVVALTRLDVASARGVEVDAARLGRRLGLPVVPVRADRRADFEPLKRALTEAVRRSARDPEDPFPRPFRDEVDRLKAVLAKTEGEKGDRAEDQQWPRHLVERLLLDEGGELEASLLAAGGRGPACRQLHEARERLERAGLPVATIEAPARYGWVARVTGGVVARPDESKVSASDRLDAVLTHRLWGGLILALVMVLMFHAVFRWSEAPMGWIDAAARALAHRIEADMADGPLRGLLAEGVVGGIGGVATFLPPILLLFFFLAVLEDCGYLARAAFLTDRLMTRMGLGGKSFIPLLSSFGCTVPGVMAARVVEDRRDRLTTILVAPLMSCSARLPVYTLLIAACVPNRQYLGGLLGLRGLVMLGLYLIGPALAVGVALMMKRTMLRGEAPPFVMELPDYKWPSPRVVVHRVCEPAREFLEKAGTIILAVSVVTWAALNYPQISPREIAPLLAERGRLEGDLESARAARNPADIAACVSALAQNRDRIRGAQQRRSALGRAGRLIEPVVSPLGWDWRIGTAVLASFPAREVVVAALGVTFDVADDEGEGGTRLQEALRAAVRPETGRRLFDLPVALSLLVFFALCAQCTSTLIVIRQETGHWGWSALTFAYMTTFAYVGALATYRAAMWLVA